jgi:hypothetical protein
MGAEDARCGCRFVASRTAGEEQILLVACRTAFLFDFAADAAVTCLCR